MIHATALVETFDVGIGTNIWGWTHVCKGAKIGMNCTIGERVYIGPNVVIGNNCKIQNHALIYEGVTIEDDVFIGPGVITTNDPMPRAVGEWKNRFQPTLIKRGASICAGAVIVCGVTIGEDAMIGAGSVVTQDIRAGWMAFGNPASHRRQMC